MFAESEAYLLHIERVREINIDRVQLPRMYFFMIRIGKIIYILTGNNGRFAAQS